MKFIREIDERIGGCKSAIYQCECGKEFKAAISSYKAGRTKSCSRECSYKKSRKSKVGNKYGKLLAIKEDFDKDICECLCDCGNTFIAKRSNLVPGKKGGPKSCGCLWAEKYGIESIKDKVNSGYRIYSKEMRSHKLYSIWSDLRRSSNKNKGTVDEWKDYKIFYEWAIDKWKPGLRSYSKNFEEKHGPNNTIFVDPSIISRESQSRPEIKEKIKKKNIEKYGYSIYTQDQKRKHLINNGKKSKQEESLRKFIETIGYKSKKDRKILEGKEIDIFIEEEKIGIEYCGIYWHSEINLKDKKYHYRKYLKCLENNIKLITIFSDEWINRGYQVKNFLRATLNVNTKIFARKCEFKKIENKTSKNFVNENHIQKLLKASSYNFGLFYEDELVSVMCFSNHPRDNNKLSLNRFCTKYGTTVVGGASKLFKNSLNYLPSEKDIYTWSDNRWSDGTLYNQLGFILEKELSPDYSYIHKGSPNERIPKQKMKKSNINCPKEKTEKLFLIEKGYYRIWDCGKKTWLYKR